MTERRCADHAGEAGFGMWPELSTTIGASEGRFVRRNGARPVEFGPVEETTRKVDERVEVVRIERLEAACCGKPVSLLA
jgi:succinyl-diaminopimelate desuccinylase